MENEEKLSELSNIAKALDEISYFSDWDISLKKQCEKFSHIKSFNCGEIIFENHSKNHQFVHFITEGKAKAIQMISLDKFKNTSFHDTDNGDAYFIEVFRLSTMSCFNVGENLHERMIVSAENPTRCLLIPRFWLLEIDKKLWHRIKFFFERNVPSKSEAEKRFLKRKEFSRYGRSLVEKIIDKSEKSQYNHVFNIPISIRMNQKELEQ